MEEIAFSKGGGMNSGQAQTVGLSLLCLCFHRRCFARCDLRPHAAATTVAVSSSFLAGKESWLHGRGPRAAAQSSALREALHLVSCFAVGVWKF